MGPIDAEKVQAALQAYVDKPVYLHLETTNGAYAGQQAIADSKPMAVCAYIRNGEVQFHRAVLAGNGPYRAGLQMANGWIYAEGLTDWEIDEEGRLLLAGHDYEGRLAICLELSHTPFGI